MPPLLDHLGLTSVTRAPDRAVTFVHLPSYISAEVQAVTAQPPDQEVSTPMADLANLPSLTPLITLPPYRHTSDTLPSHDGTASPISPTGAGGPDDLPPRFDVWQAHSHLVFENEEPPDQPVQDEADIQPLAAVLRELESGQVHSAIQVAAGRLATHFSNLFPHTPDGNFASDAASNAHTTDPPRHDLSLRPLAHSQLPVVAENDEQLHNAPQRNTTSLDATLAPATTPLSHEAGPTLQAAATLSPTDEEATTYTSPPMGQLLATTPLRPRIALVLSQQEDAPPPPTGAEDELLAPNNQHNKIVPRAQDRTVHFDISEEEATATSTEPAIQLTTSGTTELRLA